MLLAFCFCFGSTDRVPRLAIWRPGSQPSPYFDDSPHDATTDPDRLWQPAGRVVASDRANATTQQPREPFRVRH